ncbi:hypothetical protein K0B04_02535 [Patescibacteria group bacterium]|nr:hypothetical protein [Patescibacteria group bacterium]
MNNGRPLNLPSLPTPKIRVKKMVDRWVVSETFKNPHHQKQNTTKTESFDITITLLLKTDGKYSLLIKAPKLGGYQAVRENLRELNTNGFLSDYDCWKNNDGVSLFRFIDALRDGSYLKPTDRDRNGGKSSWEIRDEKWLREVDKETKYRR